MISINPMRGLSCLLAVAALSAAAPVHAATQIHNDGFTTSNLGLPNSPNYGSNVTAPDINWNATAGPWGIVGTPDIQLIWDGEGGGTAGTGLDTYIAWNGRGNVVQFDSTNSGTANSFITFVPASGAAGVAIDSFVLDAWAGGGNMAVNWTILDGSKSGDILASGTWTKGNGGGRDTISPSFRGELGQTLVLQFTRTSGAGDYLALDNLSFDQITSAPTIDFFTSLLDAIDGQPIPLDWVIHNPSSITSLTIYDGVTTTDVLPLTDTTYGTGTLDVDPVTTTTYTLTLNDTLTKQVTILGGKALSLTATATLAAAPSFEVTLDWQIQPAGAALVTIDDGVTSHDVTGMTDDYGHGSGTFTVPSASTVFVLEANDSGSTRSVRVLREQESYGNLSIDSPSLTTTGTLTVTWANQAGGPSDWVAIYRTGELPQLQRALQWNYLNGTQTIGGGAPDGSLSFSGFAPGTYYAALLLNDGYEIAEGPLMFTVMEPAVESGSIQILQAKRVGNTYVIEWGSQPGSLFDVRASNDLSGNPLIDWELIGQNLPAGEAVSTTFTEDLGAAPPPRRFYQIIRKDGL